MRPDAIGLFNGQRTLARVDNLLVLPRRYRVTPIDLPRGRRYQPGGVSLASRVGDSEEFFSLREYRPGDPRRHIHWRSWARYGKPVVKEFTDEFFVRHALVLDTFATPTQSLVFEEAVSVAASLVVATQLEDALLDLLFVGADAHRFTAGRGLATSDQLLEVLACAEPCFDKPFTALEQTVIEHATEISGCICVLLAWDRDRRRLVERLRANRVEVRVLILADADTPATLEPGPLADQPHLLRSLPIGQIQEALLALE
jgi:uncharacterized protein (DUF58 family)